MTPVRISLAALCVSASSFSVGANTHETGNLQNDGSAETVETQESAHKQAQFFFHLGQRSLTGEGWDAAQSQQAIAFVGDWRPQGWPVSPEFGLCFSASSENDQLSGEEDGVLAELSVGAKRYFGNTVRPYVGGGLALMYGGQDRLVDVAPGIRATEPDRDSSVGYYFHAGVSFRFGSKYHWGLDARVVGGTDASFFGESSSFDYSELTAFVGFAW